MAGDSRYFYPNFDYGGPTLRRGDTANDELLNRFASLSSGTTLAPGKQFDNRQFVITGGTGYESDWGSYSPGSEYQKLADIGDRDSKTPMMAWFRAGQPAPAPTPPPAPPAPTPPPAPEPPPAAVTYRNEANDYLKQAQDLIDQFKIGMSQALAAQKLSEEMQIKSQTTAAANMARSQMTPNLQIQPASGTPQTAGTQVFKRRKGPQPSTGGTTLSALNIATPSTLNV